MTGAEVLVWMFGAASVISAWLVFRVDSMVRAAFWLLASFAGVAGILVLLGAEFLGLILLLMMAGEMAIMAVFMVMFMMNPAGLNPMTMVHEHGWSIASGVFASVALGSAAFALFPSAAPAETAHATSALGTELLGGSMLIFQTAGVTLLATMICAVALVSPRGRFGDADQGSDAPALDPESGGVS